MGSSSRGSGRNVAAIILGAVGTVLGFAGAVVGLVAPRALDTEWAKLGELRPLGAASLREAPPGVRAFIEGRIASSQPVLLRQFVAYRRSERRRSEKNEETWNSKEQVTPPLLLDLADGPAQVVGAGYEMKGSLTNVHDWSVNEYLEKLYTGLVAGEGVFAVGRTTSGGLEAEFVAPGSFEAYRTNLRQSKVASLWLAGGLGGVGGLLVLGAGWLMLSARRRGGGKRAVR